MKQKLYHVKLFSKNDGAFIKLAKSQEIPHIC